MISPHASHSWRLRNRSVAEAEKMISTQRLVPSVTQRQRNALTEALPHSWGLLQGVMTLEPWGASAVLGKTMEKMQLPLSSSEIRDSGLDAHPRERLTQSFLKEPKSLQLRVMLSPVPWIHACRNKAVEPANTEGIAAMLPHGCKGPLRAVRTSGSSAQRPQHE